MSRIANQGSPITCLAFSPDGERLACGTVQYNHPSVTTYSVRNGGCLGVAGSPVRGSVVSLLFLDEGGEEGEAGGSAGALELGQGQGQREGQGQRASEGAGAGAGGAAAAAGATATTAATAEASAASVPPPCRSPPPSAPAVAVNLNSNLLSVWSPAQPLWPGRALVGHLGPVQGAVLLVQEGQGPVVVSCAQVRSRGRERARLVWDSADAR